MGSEFFSKKWKLFLALILAFSQYFGFVRPFEELLSRREAHSENNLQKTHSLKKNLANEIQNERNMRRVKKILEIELIFLHLSQSHCDWNQLEQLSIYWVMNKGQQSLFQPTHSVRKSISFVRWKLNFIYGFSEFFSKKSKLFLALILVIWQLFVFVRRFAELLSQKTEVQRQKYLSKFEHFLGMYWRKGVNVFL